MRDDHFDNGKKYWPMSQRGNSINLDQLALQKLAHFINCATVVSIVKANCCQPQSLRCALVYFIGIQIFFETHIFCSRVRSSTFSCWIQEGFSCTILFFLIWFDHSFSSTLCFHTSCLLVYLITFCLFVHLSHCFLFCIIVYFSFCCLHVFLIFHCVGLLHYRKASSCQSTWQTSKGTRKCSRWSCWSFWGS